VERGAGDERMNRLAAAAAAVFSALLALMGSGLLAVGLWMLWGWLD
jgi:hypothetical protein